MPCWFKKFRDGDESLEDEEGHSHPSAVDNDKLTLIEVNPCTAARELADK